MPPLVRNLYDSHVHLTATGQVARQLTLGHLKDIDDLAGLKLEARFFQGPWVVGFGWDENRWRRSRLPDRHDLDRLFPGHPAYLVRCDGHAAVTNTHGLKLLG